MKTQLFMLLVDEYRGNDIELTDGSITQWGFKEMFK
jgi:hypothetical protein